MDMDHSWFSEEPLVNVGHLFRNPALVVEDLTRKATSEAASHMTPTAKDWTLWSILMGSSHRPPLLPRGPTLPSSFSKAFNPVELCFVCRARTTAAARTPTAVLAANEPEGRFLRFKTGSFERIRKGRQRRQNPKENCFRVLGTPIHHKS